MIGSIGLVCVGLALYQEAQQQKKSNDDDSYKAKIDKSDDDEDKPEEPAPSTGSATPDTKKEGALRRRCRHRPVKYLNNDLEQDHRAIKRRVKAKLGFREFHAARRTIQGYEAMHMIRKGQARWVSGSDVRRQIQFINKLFEVAV